MNKKKVNGEIMSINLIKEKLNELQQDGVFPGATLGICTNRSKYLDFVGYKSIFPYKELNSLNTIYDLASLTKVIVTNTLVSLALMEKKITLSTKIDKYFDDELYKNITIYNLITHTSGLVTTKRASSIYSYGDYEDYLNTIIKENIEKARYSDINYILLGFIIEKIYNDSLDKIADIKIFKPLNMKNTTFKPNPKLCAPTEISSTRGIIKGMPHDEKSYYSNKIIGCSGLFAPIEDIIKFVQMVLNNGIVDGKVFLEKRYIDLWFKKLVTDIEDLNRGMGWIIGSSATTTKECCSDNTIIHLGFTGTMIIIDRGNNLGIVLLSNRVHPTRNNGKFKERKHEIVEAIYKDIAIYNEL